MLKTIMKQFVKSLKNKELVIFKERLLAAEPLTLREIGERYGISRERVRQIEERVKKKIRLYLKLDLNTPKLTRGRDYEALPDKRRNAPLTGRLKKTR